MLKLAFFVLGAASTCLAHSSLVRGSKSGENSFLHLQDLDAALTGDDDGQGVDCPAISLLSLIVQNG